MQPHRDLCCLASFSLIFGIGKKSFGSRPTKMIVLLFCLVYVLWLSLNEAHIHPPRSTGTYVLSSLAIRYLLIPIYPELSSDVIIIDPISPRSSPYARVPRLFIFVPRALAHTGIPPEVRFFFSVLRASRLACRRIPSTVLRLRFSSSMGYSSGEQVSKTTTKKHTRESPSSQRDRVDWVGRKHT
jgi:hypothetical protein